MREIKFRAWHKENQKMVYFDPETLCRDEYQRGHLAALMAGKHGDVLMEFAGLHDNQGNEIYEGDIVRLEWISTYIGCIRFQDGAYQHVLADGKVNAHYFQPEYAAASEVIGNIHQHSELLEAPNDRDD